MHSTVDLCYLCLTSNENRKCISLEDNDGIVIEEKCRYVLNENVNIRPEVSYICLHCLKNLNYVYKFKQMCLQNIYVHTLETKNHLKVTLTDLQYQKNNELTCYNESANEFSPPNEVVSVKQEIDDNFVLQDESVLEGEETNEENDDFSTIENTENKNDNMQYDSSLCEEVHIKCFLNRVKEETEFNIIHEEIQIKDELFEATDSKSKNISNNKLLNEGNNKTDCKLSFSEDGKNKGMDQNVNRVPTKQFKCNKCHKAFSYPYNLTRHNRTHTGFECTTGKKTSSSSTNLTRMHTDEKQYKCDVCNKKFVRKYHLIVHKRSHNNERPFKCLMCHKAFTTDSNLSTHMRIHTGEKPYQCQVCQYKCSWSSSLKRHMQIHTVEKPFQCKICQYKCVTSYILERHMHIHTEEKPFQCKICQYKCITPYILERHMRIHTGVKPFHCQVCQFKCAQTNDLIKHMRTHTGEKPFKCKHCQKAFSRSCGLLRHMRTLHIDKI